MLALKSTAAVLLAALTFAVITPTMVFQDAGPGKADDVAQLLPEDTLGFIELVRAPRLLNDWKEYVGSVTTPAGKEKACAKIEEWFTQTLEIVPEKLLKDLKAGLPSIQRIAVALTGMPGNGDTPWVIIATSSDAAFFKKIVEDDLSVFSSEEKAHGGVRVFSIRKLGELKSDIPVFVAAPGSRLLVTTSWKSMTDALDRAAGKGPATDLRKNKLYAQLAPAASDDPALRAFCSWDWNTLIGGGFGFAPERPSRMEMDQADAAFGYRKMKGAIVEAVFKPGQVVSAMKFPIDPGCRIYETFRQPAGPKDLLSSLPKKTVLYGHQNLKGGKEVWGDIEVFIKRFQEAERKANPADDSPDYVQEMNDGMKEELGFTARELAAVVGNEVVVALVDPAEAAGFENMFVLLFRTTDPAKARELMETVSKKTGKYTSETKDKMTLFSPSEGPLPRFGIRDTVVAIGLSDEIVKEALTSKDDASGAVKRLPKEAASACGLLSINTSGLVDLILKMSGTEKPEELTHMRPDDWSVVSARTEKEHAIITSTDSGYGVTLQTIIAGAPLMMLSFVGVRMAMAGGMDHMETAAAPGEKPAAEPAALPAEELAKRTGDLVPKLRSDELTVRDKASADLKALGRQAVPLLIEAYRAEKDAEAKSRLTNLLVDHKAWDVLPELLGRKVDIFLDEFRTKIDAQGEDEGWWGGYASWEDSADDVSMDSMQPYVHPEFLAPLKNAEVLQIPAALKHVAERLRTSDLVPKKRSQIAALLAFNDSGAAFPAVLELRDAATDAESRAYLTAALGWSNEAKAKEAIYRSLESKDIAIRRGAFMAAERVRDPEVVTRLFERTKDAVFETRWNAGYTLGVLTGGRLDLNAFLPDAEYDAQLEAAKKWWNENKASFQFPARPKK